MSLFKKHQSPRPERVLTKWWSYKLEDVWQHLDTSEMGLKTEEVIKRQKQYDFNVLPAKKEDSFLAVIFRQARSVLMLVLIGACLISVFLGDYIDAGVILAGILVNIFFGAWQERKTANTLKALQKVAITHARVFRGGEEKIIDGADLVPGDIVVLGAGDKVPADLRLFKIHQLKINEAVLTGESEPSPKTTHPVPKETVLADRQNMAYLGTLAVEGNTFGVVVETGSRTEFGRLQELISNLGAEKTSLQKKMDRLAIFLTRLVLVLAVLVFLFGLIFGYAPVEMLTLSVAIAVSAIPEGLAILATVILALGMQKILKKGALVKKLLAAEVLGSTDVICVDKTGTITEGNMRVVKVVSDEISQEIFDGVGSLAPAAMETTLFLMHIGVLCNDARTMKKGEPLPELFFAGNLTDRALLLSGAELGLYKNDLEKKFPRLDEVLFDSRQKFMMTLHQGDSHHNVIYLKGAPEKVLLFANHFYNYKHKRAEELDALRREKIIRQYEILSKEGLRVLALAYKEVQPSLLAISDHNSYAAASGEPKTRAALPDIYTNFVFAGLIGIKDPVRVEAKETIRLIGEAGIKTIMITGDNRFTAEIIGREIGLGTAGKNILEGDELEEMSPTEFKKVVKDIQIYARTTPEQKLKIVQAWQENGAVTAMTGDGINDAPALKQANIGISLGTGNDVAKEASDIILLNNNFQNIAAAVHEGRVIFANIKKVVLYFLSDSFSEVFIIIGALLLGWPMPVLASQIIWVNMIDDIFPALALARDSETENLMDKKYKKMEILDRQNKTLIFLISLVSAVLILFTFYIFWQGRAENFILANTISFALLGVNTLFYIFSIRQSRLPFWRVSWLKNKTLLAGVIAGFILQLLAVYLAPFQIIFRTVPLNFFHWLYVVAMSFVIMGLIELVKWIFNNKQTNELIN
ncbi:MAG: HAD-IC family P-type ATPase [Patescibacteria group bacterium]|nr:HAD-IC family P-type ATPase [Patescibacteria group bacterium]